MLPKAMRLTEPVEFASVLRTGRRVGTRQLAVHLLVPDPSSSVAASGTLEAGGPPAGENLLRRPARAGFVVSSKVGNSVVRHRVTRRLREQVRPLLTDLAAGTDVVVRAFPPAAAASSAALAADLRYAINKLRPL